MVKFAQKIKVFILTAVNEIVVKGNKSKVVHLEIYIDGNHLERFSGDGVIISTPVGSTAYNFPVVEYYISFLKVITTNSPIPNQL